MREIKFRALELDSPSGINWVYGSYVIEKGFWMDDDLPDQNRPVTRYYIFDEWGVKYDIAEQALGQYTGLKDCEGREWFIGDIGELDNGDRFVLKMEDWLEVYVDWIGEPECEDQARDLYRISQAKVIGNIHENKDLIDGRLD